MTHMYYITETILRVLFAAYIVGFTALTLVYALTRSFFYFWNKLKKQGLEDAAELTIMTSPPPRKDNDRDA